MMCVRIHVTDSTHSLCVLLHVHAVIVLSARISFVLYCYMLLLKPVPGRIDYLMPCTTDDAHTASLSHITDHCIHRYKKHESNEHSVYNYL
jgi:hypothetical protein